MARAGLDVVAEVVGGAGPLVGGGNPLDALAGLLDGAAAVGFTDRSAASSERYYRSQRGST